MKVHFYLKEANADKETPIYTQFYYRRKKFKYYLPFTIHPKYWNFEKERAIQTRRFPLHVELNPFLNRLQNEVIAINQRFVNQGKAISVTQFKNELDRFTLRGATAGETSLFGFIRQLIKERENLPKFTENTVKTYRTALKHLEAFSYNLDFEDIDLDFLADFQKYLFAPPVSLNQNTASKMVGILKTFLHEATERGINKNQAFKSRRFSVPRVEVQSIYLTTDELSILYRLDLSDRKALERVRDLFLVGAYTGLRFSDFTNIRPENIQSIDGKECIAMTTQKTGEKVVIPISPIVRSILDKYGGKPPKPISNQKMNARLKELAELAGFTQTISVTTSIGGKRGNEAVRKCDLVTTHTARRSFATNAYKAGIPAISIRAITGHRSEKSFLKYIKISKEENAVLIALNPFFNTSPLKVAK